MAKITVTKLEKQLVDRMKEKNDYVVRGVGNYWWANKNHKGALIEALSSEEKDALFSLETKGVVKLESKTILL